MVNTETASPPAKRRRRKRRHRSLRRRRRGPRAEGRRRRIRRFRNLRCRAWRRARRRRRRRRRLGHRRVLCTGISLRNFRRGPSRRVVLRASDGAPALGSGNAEESPSASRSSFWNSRTDSSADSTAKETLLDASDCLRFFRAASLRLASAPSTLLTSLKMLLLRRLRMEEAWLENSTFSLASEATGAWSRVWRASPPRGGHHVLRVPARGGGAPLCRGERRRGGSEPAMAVRCVKAPTATAMGPVASRAPPRCRAPRSARGGPRASRVYTRRVARLRVSHSRRRCVQPLRASRNARDSHSRDAWAFKSSRWTHRQLPFRRDSPRRGETNRTGISLGNSEFDTPVCTPLARATNFRFSRPRFRISGDEISLRGAPPLASARFPFGAEREPLTYVSAPRHLPSAGPRGGTNSWIRSRCEIGHGRRSLRLVKRTRGRGRDPADPRSVDSRARRGCAGSRSPVPLGFS